MTDIWQGQPTRNVFTHYFVSGTTRISHVYANTELIMRKLVIETVVAPFTDHLALCLIITTVLPLLRTRRGLWKMDTAIFN